MEEILAEEGRREMIECNRGRMGLMKKQKIFFALGTVNTITVFEDGCDRVLSMAAMRVRELHQKLSIFDQSSEIGIINQFAGEKPVAVSNDTFRLIQNACIYSKITNGYFDITTKPLNTIWKEAFKTGELPSDEIVQNTKWLTDYHDIVLNEQEKTVMLKKRGQQLDLGGIAKGYAADEAKKILLENGIANALINFGGTVINIGENRKIGIRNPFSKEEKPFAKIDIGNKAVVTSGIYEQCIEKNHSY